MKLTRKRARCLAFGIAVLGIGICPSVAAADLSPTNDYGHWVTAEWQWRLSLPITAAKHGSCITRSQQGPMWFLASSDQGSSITVECVIPDARTLMLNSPSVECSAVGPAALRPDTDAVLQRCAKRQWQQHSGGLSVTVDGKALRPAGYIIATGAFSFTQPARGNLAHTLGPTHGRAAAYGSASILGPLSPGFHTLVERLAYAHTSVVETVTYYLTVK
jgi:hypothetical protein